MTFNFIFWDSFVDVQKHPPSFIPIIPSFSPHHRFFPHSFFLFKLQIHIFFFSLFLYPNLPPLLLIIHYPMKERKEYSKKRRTKNHVSDNPDYISFLRYNSKIIMIPPIREQRNPNVFHDEHLFFILSLLTHSPFSFLRDHYGIQLPSCSNLLPSSSTVSLLLQKQLPFKRALSLPSRLPLPTTTT